MKNQMKRFVAMLLASLAILALAGCSNSGNGDGDKTADYPKENITVIVPYSAGGPTTCPCAPCWTLPASICPAA